MLLFSSITETLHSNRNLSFSCPARYNLFNPEQSRLGEAIAAGLTRAADINVHSSSGDSLVFARFGLGQSI